MGRTIQNSISTYIDDDLLASVDRLSRALGKSRASTIKWVLSQFQPGMDHISFTLESVEGDVDLQVSSFLKLMANAAGIVGQEKFDLAMEKEHSEWRRKKNVIDD